MTPTDVRSHPKLIYSGGNVLNVGFRSARTLIVCSYPPPDGGNCTRSESDRHARAKYTCSPGRLGSVAGSPGAKPASWADRRGQLMPMVAVVPVVPVPLVSRRAIGRCTC